MSVLEWCGLNNTKVAGHSSISLEDPKLFPKVYCEKIWNREFERLKVVDSKLIYSEDSPAKVLCSGNYRKISYRAFEYSEVTG